MTPQHAKRVRRAPDEARRLLIECAETLLVSGGLQAVQMRAVAREAGMTDAGVSHHFGNREGLLRALLSHGAQKVRATIDSVVSTWVAGDADIARLVSGLSEIYAAGYAELALELHSSGWREGAPYMLEPVVDRLYALNRNPKTTKKDLRLALASLHMESALEPVFGEAFRRSAGLKGAKDREGQIALRIRVLEEMLGVA